MLRRLPILKGELSPNHALVHHQRIFIHASRVSTYHSYHYRSQSSTNLRAALHNELAAQGLRVAVTAAGRGLVACSEFSPGDVVLTENSPLAASGDPATLDVTCSHCFRALSIDTFVTCTDCGTRYCTPECRSSALLTGGHEAVCRGESEINAWCAAHGHNFARVAVNAVARSLTGGRDFSFYWSKINSLAYATPPPTDALPRAHVDGYALVKKTFIFAGRLSGAGVSTFFDTIFNLRAYARLMGTLRLNAFTVNARESRNFSEAPLNNRCSSVVGDGSDSNSCTDSVNSCGSGEGSGGGGCGDTPAALGDAPGGTAIYEAASLANHACEPSCDVVISACGALALRARKQIKACEDVSITYLDSSLPVEFRRKKLLLGYGFDCMCTLCRLQLKRLHV